MRLFRSHPNGDIAGGSYDVVVVGGGSAGSLVAGRLAAETDAEVLLLESGGWDLNPLIRIPAGYSKLLARGTFVLDYSTVPQAQLDGRPGPFTQGHGIGGGSSINAMAYVRGQRRDYDRWNTAAGGDGGWSYDDLLPYFRAMEANSIFADEYHGTEGPLKVSWPREVNPLNLAAIQAFQEVGLPFNADYNGADQGGVSVLQLTLGDARRCSSADAFLHPARKRPNLTIRTHALVERLLLDGSRITGARFVHRRRRQDALAPHVIVCAGAFNSPRLLMLSGIGPEDELSRHQIPVKVTSPDVGHHLQDHPNVGLHARAGRADAGYAKDARGIPMLIDGLRYLLTHDGPAATNGIPSVAYCNPDRPDEPPTVQIFHTPIGSGLGQGPPVPGLTLETIVLQPQSRGRVTLKDADPRSVPLIDPNWLSEPDDMTTMLAGLRYGRRVLQTQALKNLVEPASTPGFATDTDEGLAEYARNNVWTNYHCVGTCRMGADDESVVDPALKVRGVNGLRVIDASVMPNLPSGNTNAPTMAIASKGLELLKADLQANTPRARNLRR